MTRTSRTDTEHGVPHEVLDAVLVGGGIMSATLGALLARVQPDWRIAVIERRDRLAAESSHPWHNAGTGHTGACELNYMPDPHDAARAEEIARQFAVTRRFWSALTGTPESECTAITPVPHMTVVFGDRDVAYLRRRYDTLHRSPMFAGMRYTEDPRTIAEWAPLVMRGRPPGEPIAATRFEDGTDVDFGAITHELTNIVRDTGSRLLLRHEVTSVTRGADGSWKVGGRDRATGLRFTLRTRFVFVGAGGATLRLLQKAGVPEVRGYAVLPVGAQFLRTDEPSVVAAHDAKVYSQAPSGAPPMSVPHLDKRVVDGRASLMFGPYATFSTRLLRAGRLTDFFATVRRDNLRTLAGAAARNLPLVRYLIGQLLATRGRKFAQLRRFYPTADPAHWRLVTAGQRAQLVKPDPRGLGVLVLGTELVTSADGTIAGLLGASPGASTAPSIMSDLLERCFPDRHARWAEELDV
ncbi:malate dehydrogenase (quinone) [Prescottella sp. R16]|uniref:malate dehydrogenase (quinone) n=1 Tax=Prescottella sp. R16 TaxID=3064529 RepID=UPI00272E220E|nr:malate dehydrogenase (quinone) [Prescottella sp. R16]